MSDKKLTKNVKGRLGLITFWVPALIMIFFVLLPFVNLPSSLSFLHSPQNSVASWQFLTAMIFIVFILNLDKFSEFNVFGIAAKIQQVKSIGDESTKLFKIFAKQSVERMAEDMLTNGYVDANSARIINVEESIASLQRTLTAIRIDINKAELQDIFLPYYTQRRSRCELGAFK